MSDLFGWDLVYRVSESSINKKEDNLALLLHFLLIKNGFKCVGLGDAGGVGAENEKGSELLPSGWSDSNCYSIRYVADGVSFVLRGVPVNSSIVFNLLETKSLAVSNAAFIAEEEVANMKGSSLESMFAKSAELIKRINDGLIRPVKERQARACDANTQTPPAAQPPHVPNPSVPDLVSPQRTGSGGSLAIDPLRDPLRVGGADLDPLGGLGGGMGRGGGMLFDPFHDPMNRPDPASGLPRGSVPPGARFDPFAPPGAGGPRRPPHRGPPDFDLLDPFGGSGGSRPFGGGGGGMFM